MMGLFQHVAGLRVWWVFALLLLGGGMARGETRSMELPRAFEWIDKLFPSVKADAIKKIHTSRTKEIYAALKRYGQENEQWFRVSILDKKTNAWVFPENAIQRLIKRKLLQPKQSRDLWGNIFALRKRKSSVENRSHDQRLRFVELVSAGPDGRLGSKDDLGSPPYHGEQGER